MAEPRPPPPLQHRPEARSFSVEDLVRKVLDGQIRVPAFQRPLKWEIQDVLDLLDSVFRGYPVGTLLLWQRPAGAERLRYGSIEFDAVGRSDALLVVDGQQRVRALTQSLAGAGRPREPFAAYFDLRAARFVRLGERDEPQPHHVPMNEVLDSERLIAWVLARQVPETDRRAVIQLGKRIREFQIPAYLVATEDEASVQEIFRRANDTGRGMEIHEVFNAIHHRSSGPSPANVRDVANELAALQFGGPDEATLMRMLAAIRGVDASKERVPLLGDDAHKWMLELQSAATATVAFLRRDANIPHMALLPYQQPLFALARLFHRFPEPHARSRELLARWLWRGALTGFHVGNLIRTREMNASIGDDEHAAVRSLLETVPNTPPEPTELGEFNWHAARSRVQVLALLDLGPRNFLDGSPVFSAQDIEEPSDEMREAPWQRLVRTIFDRSHSGLENRVIHGAITKGIWNAIANCDDADVLASHAISPEARRALKFGRDDEFLDLRAVTLARVVDAFAARRAAWGELDAPAVDSLLPSEDA